jgi:MraZ protein
VVNCGKKECIFTIKSQKSGAMAHLIGEYDCKLDAKGRFVLPSGLKKQLMPGDQERFVINRGFEKNLTLYPDSEWQKISREINSLNLYNKKNREFVRYFFRGASELTTDATNRLLLPKSLMEYAGIDKEIVLFAYGQRIEIWARDLYDEMMRNEPEDFSSLAEEVMGKISNESGGENVP